MLSKALVFAVIVLFIGAGIGLGVTGDNSSFGNTIYVDDDSECPGDGSIELPYCTIQYAIDNASDGDTIFVYNGGIKL